MKGFRDRKGQGETKKGKRPRKAKALFDSLLNFRKKEFEEINESLSCYA